jgi:hypothetical protein
VMSGTQLSCYHKISVARGTLESVRTSLEKRYADSA